MPLDYAPGTSYKYSNENYIILSYFVEKFSNMNLRDYLKQHIFLLVGMSDTLFDSWYRTFQEIENLATSYWDYSDLSSEQPTNRDYIRRADRISGSTEDEIPIEYFAYGSCMSTDLQPGYQAGSGGLISTIQDMTLWYNTLFLSKNATLISEESLNEILTPISYIAYHPGSGCEFFGLGIVKLFRIR